MKKLLIVSQGFEPEFFPINLFAKNLPKNYKVDILTGKPNYPKGKIYPGYSAFSLTKEIKKKYTIYRVPIFPRGTNSNLRILLNYFSFIISGIILGSYLLKGKKYDYIFVYATSTIFQSFIAIFFKIIKKKVKLILWVQDLWPEVLKDTGVIKNKILLKILDKIINNDPKKISWTVNLKKSLSKGVKYNYGEGSIVEYLYRPFCKNYIYLDKNLIERPSKMSKIFPKLNLPNIFICLPGLGSDRNFSSFISKDIIDNNFFNGGTQCFPLYIYDNEVEKDNNFSLFKTEEDIEQFNGYKRKINITDELFKKYFNILKFKISKEDIFYYIYGILNSSYKEKFNIELKKEIARIPLQKNFKIFSKAGRDLANLHLNYEDLDPYPLKNINIIKSENYAVRKMKFGKNSEGADKTLIIYNENIVLKGIPLEAYNYVINGKSAIEWVMERYQVSIDRDSDIENDPNDYCIENKDPQYILNLLKKVINLSIQSVKIINSLPKIDETIS